MKFRNLEAVVLAGGGSLALGGEGNSSAAAEAAVELARLAQQVAEQDDLIHVLQHNLEEFQVQIYCMSSGSTVL